MILDWDLTKKSYDLNVPAARLELRNDLFRHGFFEMDGCSKYYRWFERDHLPEKEMFELMGLVMFFTKSTSPYDRSRRTKN